MDAPIPPDLGVCQILLRHGSAVFHRYRTPQAQPTILLPQHLPVLQSEEVPMGYDSHCRSLGNNIRHRCVCTMLSPQLLLDQLGPRAQRNLPEHQCHWMGKRCHQYCLRPVDVSDTPIPASCPESSLEEENRRGIDVLCRDIVSAIPPSPSEHLTNCKQCHCRQYPTASVHRPLCKLAQSNVGQL